jgi:hypothetical protein
MRGDGLLPGPLGDLFVATLHLGQPETDLVAEHIPTQQESPIGRCPNDEVVKFCVEARDVGEEFGRTSGRDISFQCGKRLSPRMFGGKPRCHRVDHQPNCEYLFKIAGVEGRHPGVAGSIELDQTPQLQLDQRLSNRCPAHAEFFGKERFRNTRPGFELTGNDCLR